MEKIESKEITDDNKFIENNEINDISTTSTQSIIEYGVNEERFIDQKNDNEIKQLDISDENIILEDKKKLEEIEKQKELEKYFIHKRMKKPSLLENKQLEEEKEDFQEVLDLLKIYKPIEYKPDEELIKKRNYILSPQAKNRLSLLNHYISNGIHVILEGPTGTSKTLSADIICKSLGRESVKYNLNAETKINDLIKKYVADSNSVTGLSIKEGPLLHCIKYGKCCIFDEINLVSPSVLHCMEDCLNSRKLTVNLPGLKFEEINMSKNFCLIATQNPNTEEFKDKRNELTQKFLSNFQVIKFDKFTKEEIKTIAFGLAEQFDLKNCKNEAIKKNEKQIIEELTDFHNEWSEIAFNQVENKQIYTIREISASLDAFKNGENIYDTIMIIYGARYENETKNKIERMLKEKYKTIYKFKDKSEQIEIPKYLDDYFMNESLREVIKSINFSFRNKRHVILTGQKGNGKTTIAKAIAENYNKLISEKNEENNLEEEDIFFEICTSEIKITDLIGKLKTDKNKIAEWNDGIMLKAIKQGKCIVLDRINEAPSNVSERFNSLYDKTYNNEKPIFEVSENCQENKIDIHPNFR